LGGRFIGITKLFVLESKEKLVLLIVLKNTQQVANILTRFLLKYENVQLPSFLSLTLLPFNFIFRKDYKFIALYQGVVTMILTMKGRGLTLEIRIDILSKFY
jgi:hypothetical protein